MATQLERLAPLVLYKLKREYGAPIDIYKLVSDVTDVRTGVKTVETEVHVIKRAIILPAYQTRESTSVTELTKKSNAFGSVDSSKRTFIIDRKEAPTLSKLSTDHWIVYKTSKYQIETIRCFEFDSGWLIVAKELVGELPEREVRVKVDSILGLTSSTENE